MDNQFNLLGHIIGKNLTYADHLAFEKTASGEAKVLFDEGIAVSCTAKLGILSFVVTFLSTYQNRTSGLLGVFNGNPNDDFLTADGYTFPYSESAQLNDSQIFTFGMTWKTTPGDTIFLYNTSNGESWYTYNNNSFQPMFLDNLLSSSDPALLKDANSSCNGDKNCIFDILSTGSFAVGSATMNSNTVYTERRVLMESFPPNISGSAIIMGSLKEKVLMSYTAEESVFSLLATSTDVIISENGSLSWLPSSSATVFATIIANNSKAITQLAITFILCNCSNNATCDYLNAVQRGEWNSSKFMTASCNCSDGWTGEFCTEDFNACLGNTCFNTSSCIDEPPPSSGFKCSPCPPGLSGDLAGIKCFDIDECYTNISSCEQICINTLGGYTCSCNTGYAPDPANAHLCKDINECALPSLNNCSNTFICINTNGSYYCECLPGYTGPNCSDVIQITTEQPTTKSNISQTTSTPVPPKSTEGTTLNVNPVTYSAHSPEQPSTLSLTASTSLKSTSHSVTEFVHTSMNSTYNTNATEMNAATPTATTTATSATSASSGAINSSVSTSTIVVGENTLRLFTATPTARRTVSSTSESTGTIRTSSASPPATNSTTSHATTTYTASTAPRITESMPLNMTSTITNATSPATSSVRTTIPYLTSTISTPRTTNNIREAVNISVNATSNYNATGISATSSTTTKVNAVSADTASSASSAGTTTVNSTTTVSASTFNSSSTTKGTSTVNATTSRETTTSKTPTSAASATTSSTDVIQKTTAQPTAKSNISQTTSTLVPPLSTGGTTLNVNPVTYSAHSPEQPSTLSLTASTSLKSTSHSVTEFVHTSMNSTYNTNATEMNAATTTATTTATSATSASSGAINSSVSTSTIVVGENTLRLFTATPTARHTVSSTSESTGTIRASSASPPATNSTTSHATTIYTASTAPRITESMPSNMTSTITNATTPATSSGRTTTPYLTSTISTTRTTNNIREAVNTSVNATSNYNATGISATSSTTTKVNAVSADTASSASSTGTTTVNSTTTVSASTFKSSSTTKGTSTVNATTSRETTTSKTPTSAASATTSSTGAPISNCSSTFCQVGSCFNGGTCTINTLTCTEQCKCPAPYEGSRCLSVANVFTPQPSKEIPKRIVGIKLWIKGENGSGLSDSSSVKYIGLQQAVNLTATGYLQAVMAFDKNTKILLNNVNGDALTTITSQFTYSNNATIITFLNENLMSTIISVFNSKTTSRRRRDTSAVTFGLMSPDNITDVQSGHQPARPITTNMSPCLNPIVHLWSILKPKTDQCEDPNIHQLHHGGEDPSGNL
ncbi:uncharacterized protein [Hyperolius riggenbachi]|uniref:uncharacterized protein n=1 Tax=Hyperolius riggenbachi TaxID=752182 RepID=UPI0035A33681